MFKELLLSFCELHSSQVLRQPDLGAPVCDHLLSYILALLELLFDFLQDAFLFIKKSLHERFLLLGSLDVLLFLFDLLFS